MDLKVSMTGTITNPEAFHAWMDEMASKSAELNKEAIEKFTRELRGEMAAAAMAGRNLAVSEGDWIGEAYQVRHMQLSEGETPPSDCAWTVYQTAKGIPAGFNLESILESAPEGFCQVIESNGGRCRD